jgi:hypothetical protein
LLSAMQAPRWCTRTNTVQPAKPDNRHFREYPLTGHAADMPKSTRMTQSGPGCDRAVVANSNGVRVSILCRIIERE